MAAHPFSSAQELKYKQRLEQIHDNVVGAYDEDDRERDCYNVELGKDYYAQTEESGVELCFWTYILSRNLEDRKATLEFLVLSGLWSFVNAVVLALDHSQSWDDLERLWLVEFKYTKCLTELRNQIPVEFSPKKSSGSCNQQKLENLVDTLKAENFFHGNQFERLKKLGILNPAGEEILIDAIFGSEYKDSQRLQDILGQIGYCELARVIQKAVDFAQVWREEEMEGQIRERYKRCLVDHESAFANNLAHHKHLVEVLYNQGLLNDKQLQVTRSFPTKRNQVVLKAILSTTFDQHQKLEHAFYQTENWLSLDVIEMILFQVFSPFNNYPVSGALSDPGRVPHGSSNYYLYNRVLLTFDQVKVTMVREDDAFSAARHMDVDHLIDLFFLDNFCMELKWEDGERSTPLHYVIQNGESEKGMEFVKVLLKHVRYIVNIKKTQNLEDDSFPQSLDDFLMHKDKRGQTALHDAVKVGSLNMVEYLVNLRPSLMHIPNSEGETPLCYMYKFLPHFVYKILDRAPIFTRRNINGLHLLQVDFSNVIGTKVRKRVSSVRSPEPTETASEMETFDLEEAGNVRQMAESAEEDFDLEEVQNDNECSLLSTIVLGEIKTSQDIILAHPTVHLFLDLKWEKLRLYIYILIFFYIAVHFFYTLFVVQKYIVDFPFQRGCGALNATLIHPGMNQTCADVEVNFQSPGYFNKTGQNLKVTVKSLLFFEYLAGFLTRTKVFFSIPTTGTSSWIFVSFSILLTVIELVELAIGTEVQWRRENDQNTAKFVLKGVLFSLCCMAFSLAVKMEILFYISVVLLILALFHFSLRPDSRCGLPVVQKLLFGLFIYLNNLENFLQILFILTMFTVSRVETPEFPAQYVNAAASVVFAWTLILIQMSHLFGAGTYVQMIKMVTKRVIQTFLTYAALILAFCVAFSILFREDSRFLNLPGCFFRVFAMMGGEFNWDDIFGKERNFDPALDFLVARHVLHATFNVVVTIVLVNLLIGLSVSDIEGIRNKSGILHRAAQIERLYIIESIIVTSINLVKKLRRSTPVDVKDKCPGDLKPGLFRRWCCKPCMSSWRRFFNWSNIRVVPENKSMELILPVLEVDAKLMKKIRGLLSEKNN